MRPITIDFVAARTILRPSLGWSILATCVLAITLFNYTTHMEELENTQARLAAEKQLIAAEFQQFDNEVEVTPERVSAINDAILRLNTPWNDLLNALELSLDEDVALLTVNPNSAQRQLNIIAETKNPAAMTHFVSRLVEDPFLTNTILQRHRIEEGASGRPYRFTIEARWVDR
tara:strand:+ start:15791 stop:16312 length:522 start_codon:yes stop_codon:yes gene_type:complete